MERKSIAISFNTSSASGLVRGGEGEGRIKKLYFIWKTSPSQALYPYPSTCSFKQKSLFFNNLSTENHTYFTCIQ